ncbi:MAG: hypothetical protein IJ106_10170 [Parasporobacterium sp.]|nr:hypothetical protein [Parasporobacterium sp.]
MKKETIRQLFERKSVRAYLDKEIPESGTCGFTGNAAERNCKRGIFGLDQEVLRKEI